MTIITSLHAQQSGVTLLRGIGRRARLSGNRMIVALAKDEINAKVVVDASGIESSLPHQMGMEPMRHPEDIAWALEADVEHKGLGDEIFFQYWIGSMAPGWKATFSPAGGNNATLGVFVRGHGQNVQPFFNRFLKIFKDYKASQYKDIEDLKILSIRQGGDPICVLPGEIVADSFMVTGGAAGQSGLAYSMRAGTICGTVAAEAVAFGDVSQKSISPNTSNNGKESFIGNTAWGRASLETLAGMKDEDIDRLIRGLSGKMILSGGVFPKKSRLCREKSGHDPAKNTVRSGHESG